MLTAATAALRLLPLLLGKQQLQQEEAGAAEPAEATAAAARQAGRRCLQTAELAGNLLFSYIAQQINNGLMAYTEPEPSQFIVWMLQLQFAAALPLRAQVLELHTEESLEGACKRHILADKLQGRVVEELRVRPGGGRAAAALNAPQHARTPSSCQPLLPCCAAGSQAGWTVGAVGCAGSYCGGACGI